jgi:predicted metal-dependent peptidase
MRRHLDCRAGARDYTYSRPSRRAAALPGVVLAALRDSAPPTVACVVDTSGNIQEVRHASEITFTGGGGTDLRPAGRAVAATRPPPDLVVILTDGYTPWDATPPTSNPRARYLAVLVAGPVSGVPVWLDSVVVDPATTAGRGH